MSIYYIERERCNNISIYRHNIYHDTFGSDTVSIHIYVGHIEYHNISMCVSLCINIKTVYLHSTELMQVALMCEFEVSVLTVEKAQLVLTLHYDISHVKCLYPSILVSL